MPDRPDAALRPRRNPSQGRSQHTVGALLEATGLLPAESGDEALTTNLIAERAGVSIGTLYQYFATRRRSSRPWPSKSGPGCCANSTTRWRAFVAQTGPTPNR